MVETNEWSYFATQDIGFSSSPSKTNLVVYKNTLVACGEDKNQLYLAKFDLLDLDCKRFDFADFKTYADLKLSISKSSEEQRLESLFLSEKDSDITFRIQDKTFPAHKEVLSEKSQYFANLLNSQRYFSLPLT